MDFPGIESFTVVGINHRSAPVALREKFNLDTEKKTLLLERARREEGITSLFIISTCNRTEIVARETSSDELIRLLTACSDGTLKEFNKYGFVYAGYDAIEHLFKVTTGLDSQILGDLQIIKQVKEGYELSSELEMLDSAMHRLIQHVFRAHKRSRNETSLGHGTATVAYAAVKYACRSFESLHDINILLVGTGKMGKVTCKNLLNKGAKNLTIINRTRERAEFMAGRFNVAFADMEHLPQHIAEADMVIVATGSNEPVITMDHMLPSVGKAEYKVMIDLSVPRNIDPEAGQLEFVDIVNLDMLSDAVDQAFRTREKEIPNVKKIIDEELEVYRYWLHEQKVVPTIKALIDKFNTIRDREMEYFRNRIPSEDIDKMEKLTRRIVNKIAAYGIEHLRDHHPSAKVKNMVEDMFRLNTGKVELKEKTIC